MNNLFGLMGGATYLSQLMGESEPSFATEEWGVAILSLVEPREQLPKVSFVETLQVQLLPLPARALIRCTYSKTLAMMAVAVIGRYARWRA